MRAARASIPLCLAATVLAIVGATRVAVALADEAGHQSALILIKAGRLLDVRTGRYVENAAVLVDKDRIREAGPAAVVAGHAPKEVAVVDLGSAVLLPGLIDCHAHLLDAMQGRMSSRENLLSTVAQLGPARRALLGAAMAREDLDAGITTVRNVGHSGVDGDAALRDAIEAGWVTGPRIQAATRKLTPPGGQAVTGMTAAAAAVIDTEFITISGVDEARRAVREDLHAGADVIKIVAHEGNRLLGPDEVRAIVEEAHRAHVKVAAHAWDDTAIGIVVDAGVDSVEHGDEISDANLRKMRDKGIFLVATDRTPQAWMDLFGKSLYATPEETAEFAQRAKGWSDKGADRLRRAMKAGVKIAFGTDMWHEFPGMKRGAASLLTLEAYRDAGMPPLQIIQTATVNAADLLGWQDRVGVLEAGRFADIIAVAGDPLREITELEHVIFVMKGGVVVRNDLAED